MIFIVRQEYFDLASSSLNQIPQKEWDFVQEHSELLNLPRIGHFKNFAWSTLQVNFAGAQPMNSRKFNIFTVCNLFM